MSRFFLGDKVTNQKLGKPVCGIVDGILPAIYYGTKNKEWGKIYPKWKNKYVIYIKLKEPYQIGKETHDYLVFPEEDLILLGDLFNENCSDCGS